jgi:hypothetical protein
MWTYQHSSVELSDATAERLAIGYSGSPAGKNNLNKQDVPCVGPIPRGTYRIGEPFSSSEHGPWAMHLEPDAANEMFGRSGFLLHGDSIEHPGCASEGCIIMPRPVREKVWKSQDHRLSVIE